MITISAEINISSPKANQHLRFASRFWSICLEETINDHQLRIVCPPFEEFRTNHTLIFDHNGVAPITETLISLAQAIDKHQNIFIEITSENPYKPMFRFYTFLSGQSDENEAPDAHAILKKVTIKSSHFIEGTIIQ
jgi:hypothetical protein